MIEWFGLAALVAATASDLEGPDVPRIPVLFHWNDSLRNTLKGGPDEGWQFYHENAWFLWFPSRGELERLIALTQKIGPVIEHYSLYISKIEPEKSTYISAPKIPKSRHLHPLEGRLQDIYNRQRSAMDDRDVDSFAATVIEIKRLLQGAKARTAVFQEGLRFHSVESYALIGRYQTRPLLAWASDITDRGVHPDSEWGGEDNTLVTDALNLGDLISLQEMWSTP